MSISHTHTASTRTLAKIDDAMSPWRGVQCGVLPSRPAAPTGADPS